MAAPTYIVTYDEIRALGNIPAAVPDTTFAPHLRLAIADVERRMNRPLTTATTDELARQAAACFCLSYAVPFLGMLYVDAIAKAAQRRGEIADLTQIASDTERKDNLVTALNKRAEHILCTLGFAQTALYCEVV